MERRALDLHLALCPFVDRPRCAVHDMDKSLSCTFDGERVCPKCFLTGPHRHHRCLPWTSLRAATLQTTAVSIATSLPATSSAGYWVHLARQYLATTTPPLPEYDLTHLPSLYALAAVQVAGDRQAMEGVITSLGGPSVVLDQTLINLFAEAVRPATPAPRPAASRVVASSPEVPASLLDVEAELQLEMESSRQRFKDQFDFAGLRVRATPLVSVVKAGEVNHVPILLDVLSGRKQQDEALPATRPPFSLMIVLDRSGSMAGAKLEMCKDAIKACLDRIGPEDLLHLVMYDDMADVVFVNGSVATRPWNKEQVSSVAARGGTNISAGLERGFEILTSIPNTAGHIKRIFLFSDGVATTRQSEILPLVGGFKEAGVLTSSFGIGADFDERVMKGVSDHGSGTYFFISTPDSIHGIVEKGMRGVERILATDAVLTITGAQGQPVVKIGDGAAGKAATSSACSIVRLGDVRESGLKQVLVELDWQDHPASGAMVPLAHYTLQFKLHGVEPITVNGTVTARATDDWADLGGDYDPAVEVHLAIHEVSVLDRLGLQAAERGDFGAALYYKEGARDLLEAARPKDQVGFVSALLVRCHQRIGELRATVSSRGTKSAAMVRKELHNDKEMEECEDMGFGLFD